MSENEHGVVYTKRWVVDMILDLVGYIPGTGISDRIIVEPSCGCGAFMTAIAERLADEIRPSGNWEKLRRAAAGFDIDPDSIATCAGAVIQALINGGCPEANAQEIAHEWLHCADFILDDVPVCDFIVGNPPYVRSTDINREKRSAYCKALRSMTAGCDLYVGFFDRGLDVLRPGGQLCFICADRWLQNAYGRRLRQRVGSEYNLETVVRMHGVDAFEDEVDAYPSVTLVRNAPAVGRLKFVNCSLDFSEYDVATVLNWLNQPSGDLLTERFEAFEIERPKLEECYPLGNSKLVEFVTRAREKLPCLEEAGIRLGIGVATGCDDVFITDNEHLVEPDRMMPLFYMRDHRRGDIKGRWLVNPWGADNDLVNLNRYPRLQAYFETHRSRLQRRHVAQKNPSAWYRTIDKVVPNLVDRELLLMPDMSMQPDPILSKGYYPHHNCYWISSDEWDLRALGGLLMAETTRNFIDALGVKMRGGTLRFQAQYLRLVHLPRYDQLNDFIRNGLMTAFEKKDRDAATYFAELAYGEAMQ